MSKFADFLKGHKIDPRRVQVASRQLETLGVEDRAIRRAKRQARGGKDDEAIKVLASKKPRSGRPVAAPTLNAAIGGRPLSGPAKTRILKAVNHLLSKSKKEQVSLRELF